MDALFSKSSGSLFQPDPLPKPFYCPTTPIKLDTEVHNLSTPSLTPTTSHHDAHWDLVASSTTVINSALSTSGSSKFNESWPSNSEGTPGPGRSLVSTEGDRSSQSGVKIETSGTLAKYINRFRKAPPTDRMTRDKPSQPFWWKHDHLTPLKSHVTPPKTPQDHSTPDSIKTVSHTSPSPRMSSLSHPYPSNKDSLDSRSQDLIDKSTSLLSSVSSIPAQKYLNTRSSSGTVNRRSKDTKKQDPPVAPMMCLSSDHQEDILYQWRLKRRLEVARGEADLVQRESKPFCEHSYNSGWAGHRIHTDGNTVHPSSGRQDDDTMQESSACKQHTASHVAYQVNGHSCVERYCGCKINKEQCFSYGSVLEPAHNCIKDVGSSEHIACSGNADASSGPKQKQSPPPKHAQSANQHINTEPSSTQQHVACKPIAPGVSDSEPVSKDMHSSDGNGVPNEDSEEVTLSNFSLDFTTEIDHTPLPAQTSQNDECAGRGESIKPLVSQVISERLFGEDLSSTPQHTVTPNTPTPVQLPFTSSTNEATSKEHLPTTACHSKGLPWDWDMNDDLLKTLISKARLFEDQLKNIDHLLATMH